MKNVRVRLVGETWTVDIDLLDGYLQEPEAGYLSIHFPIGVIIETFGVFFQNLYDMTNLKLTRTTGIAIPGHKWHTMWLKVPSINWEDSFS